MHYFPGMWAWDRTIVRPLVLKAAGEAADVRRALRRLGGRASTTSSRCGSSSTSTRASPIPRGDGDLAAPDGRAVHYQGRAHALVVDDDRAHWLLVHRFGPWTPPEVLRLDQAAVTAAWAWEATFLDARIDGVLYNELTLDGRFRRTRLRLARGAIAQAGASWRGRRPRWSTTDLADLPDPGPDCPSCPFLAPCLAMQDGHDVRGPAAPRLPAPSPEVLEEGRLGGATWAMGRGAMPGFRR